MTISACPIAEHFNPLPPHGGRRIRPVVFGGVCIFQSTPSAWRETALTLHVQRGVAISIHSLRMEGDDSFPTACIRRLDFNPLPPHGGRPSLQSAPDSTRNISIHSLRMEGDGCTISENQIRAYFNPLPPHGGRLHSLATVRCPDGISIHSLRMEGDHYQCCNERHCS